MIVNSSCRHAFESSGGTGKDYRTAGNCISADGQVLAPFLIFSGKNVMSSWRKGGLEGANYGVTEGCSIEILLLSLYGSRSISLGMDRHFYV